MLVSNSQLQNIEGAAENQFIGKLVAQQAKSFPQLQSSSATQATALVTSSVAVAMVHGFSKQQEIAVCSNCILPFIAGSAKTWAATGEGASSLQTLVADTKSVLSKIDTSLLGSSPTGDPLAGLKQQCAALATSTGNTPLNIDRSGPVVPFTQQSPVKATDLLSPACSALPAKSKGANQAVTKSELTAAVATVKNAFPDTKLGSTVQDCKPLVDLEFRRVYWDGTPIANIPYTITLSDGSTRSGTTDGNGLGSHTSVPPGPAKVVYGENKNTPKSSIGMSVDPDFLELLNFNSIGSGS